MVRSYRLWRGGALSIALATAFPSIYAQLRTAPAAANTDVPAASAGTSLPPPVPGYPIGWCIRAKLEVFVDAKVAGFEFVELALQDVLGLPDAEFNIFASVLQSNPPRALSGYNPIPRELKIVGPEVDTAALDAHLRRLIDRAAALKLDFLIFNSGAAWRVPEEFPSEQAFNQLVEFSRRFADEAGKKGITVLVEPMRSADSNQITTIAEAIKLVETVNNPHFQMMVDYSFLTIQKDDPRALLAAGKRLRHVHLANPSANRSYPMDDSDSDYAAFFDVLKQIGYRGGLSVHGGTKSFATDAPRAITFLREKARKLAAD
jgi:D-psicose/D-tagatose/L-ribulose 3-epimerase